MLYIDDDWLVYNKHEVNKCGILIGCVLQWKTCYILSDFSVTYSMGPYKKLMLLLQKIGVIL